MQYLSLKHQEANNGFIQTSMFDFNYVGECINLKTYFQTEDMFCLEWKDNFFYNRN